MTNALMITGEKAADIAAIEAKIDEFNTRVDIEHRQLQENYRDVVCSAFDISKEDYNKYELSLTSKFYKQFGVMFLEKHENALHDLFEGLGDGGEEPPATSRVLN